MENRRGSLYLVSALTAGRVGLIELAEDGARRVMLSFSVLPRF